MGGSTTKSTQTAQKDPMSGVHNLSALLGPKTHAPRPKTKHSKCPTVARSFSRNFSNRSSESHESAAMTADGEENGVVTREQSCCGAIHHRVWGEVDVMPHIHHLSSCFYNPKSYGVVSALDQSCHHVPAPILHHAHAALDGLFGGLRHGLLQMICQ